MSAWQGWRRGRPTSTQETRGVWLTGTCHDNSLSRLRTHDLVDAHACKVSISLGLKGSQHHGERLGASSVPAQQQTADLARVQLSKVC
jgi:hypothetical protein